MVSLTPLKRLLDVALPPRCPGCGAIVRDDHRFCAACWTSLRFIAPPWCASCNRPFDHDRGVGAVCAPCLAHPPHHAGVRAAVAYGDVARTVALRLKYGGRAAFAKTAARLMMRSMPARADLIVPVPLHRWRLWRRGYNQAGLIAAALSRETGVAWDPDLLVRRKATPVLRGLGARARARTVAGAFALRYDGVSGLDGRAVVLVDDVYTSGATTDACTRLLLRGGADSVTISCWARVLDDALD